MKNTLTILSSNNAKCLRFAIKHNIHNNILTHCLNKTLTTKHGRVRHRTLLCKYKNKSIPNLTYVLKYINEYVQIFSTTAQKCSA